MTLLPVLAIAGGLAVLVWSAGRFVAGAAALARAFGMPPLLIGMLIVGFGTSAPEMLVSALAAWEGRPGLALGNAYGSNIANIALILGLTALISPIAVNSKVLMRELPILLGVTVLSLALLHDLRFDAARRCDPARGLRGPGALVDSPGEGGAGRQPRGRDHPRDRGWRSDRQGCGADGARARPARRQLAGAGLGRR